VILEEGFGRVYREGDEYVAMTRVAVVVVVLLPRMEGRQACIYIPITPKPQSCGFEKL